MSNVNREPLGARFGETLGVEVHRRDSRSAPPVDIIPPMSKRHREDSLSPEKLQLFAASIAGLPPHEMRQAKLLYIRNAIAELRAQEEMLASFGKLQGCLSVIPFFWPVLAMQKKMIATHKKMARQKITNAIDVWRADLQAEGFDVSRFNLDDDGSNNNDGDFGDA